MVESPIVEADERNSSYDVTLAFCKRAAIAQQLVRHPDFLTVKALLT